MPKPLYLTYNPNVDIEQNTALRLQTISNLYAVSVELPARVLDKSGISIETQNRIARSAFVLAFSLYKMSSSLQKELHYAMSLGKHIVVIYDKKIGKTINFNEYPNFQEVHIDFDNTDAALHQIAQYLQRSLYAPITQNPPPSINNEDSIGLGTILGVVGIGLGLLALWGVTAKK